MFGQARKEILSVIGVITIASCATASECDVSTGMSEIAQGRHIEAFLSLKECEKSEDVSADVLIALAYLYYDEEASGISDLTERAQKSWDLLEAAALTGDIDAVQELAAMYEVGNSELGFEPEFAVSECLFALTENISRTDEAVKIKKPLIEVCLAEPSN